MATSRPSFESRALQTSPYSWAEESVIQERCLSSSGDLLNPGRLVHRHHRVQHHETKDSVRGGSYCCRED